MSKLVDRMNNLNKAALPAMGFHTANVSGKSASMVVLAELTGKSEDEIKNVAGAGAVACIVDGVGLNADALSKYMNIAASMSIGLKLNGVKDSSAWKLVTGDIDFVVFDPDTNVGVFEGKDLESTGKVLALTLDTESGLLRSVHSLYPDIDAILIDLRAADPTVGTLMNCRRLADFTGQPVLALVNGPLTEVELLALRGAGIKGIILSVNASVDDIKDTVERVATLPKPERRKDNQSVALLPKLGLAPAVKEENEGGDDGDDDDDE